MTPFKQFPLALPEPPPRNLSAALLRMQMQEEKAIPELSMDRVYAYLEYLKKQNRWIP